MFLHLCVITFPLQSAACSQAYLNEIPDLLQNDSDTPLPNPNKPQHPLTKQEAWLHIPIHGFTGLICIVRPDENLAQTGLIQSPPHKPPYQLQNALQADFIFPQIADGFTAAD